MSLRLPNKKWNDYESLSTSMMKIKGKVNSYQYGISEVKDKLGVVTVYFELEDHSKSFAIVGDYFDYPPFDRKKMIKLSKEERRLENYWVIRIKV